MKEPLDIAQWNRLAQKNALHRASIHIESRNIEKTAEALSDIDALVALQFLYDGAHAARMKKLLDKAHVMLEAAKHIRRPEYPEKAIEKKARTVRAYPAEIFAIEI